MDFPSNGVWNIDGIEIDSNFESGNLASVEYNVNAVSDEDAIDRRQGRRPMPDLEFRCTVAPDMHKTEFENKNRSWFHFRVRGAHGKCLRFNIMNLNRHGKLFNQGMAPVYVSHDPAKPMPNIMTDSEQWHRVQSVFSHTSNGEFILSFWQRIMTNDDIFFSFSYPCSVRDQTEYLDRLEKLYKREDSDSHSSNAIYFHRELLCQTIESRKVELITISSYKGITDEHEPNFAHNLPPPLPTRAEHGEGERPVGPSSIYSQNRTARRFVGKRVYIISARVHPGETPSSHVLRGMVDFILRKSDKRAQALRHQYIFKVIPIINPDGVARGHYRTDARGQNLNRYYNTPDSSLQPQCFAYRQLVWHCHNHYRLEPQSGSTQPQSTKANDDGTEVIEDSNSGLAFLIDLHAHAAKRGAFLYGNRLKSSEYHSESLLYARLSAANSLHMDFDGCCFSQRNMTWKDKREGLSKEGSARVSFYYLTGSPHIYTLECNYNIGRHMNAISDSRGGAITPPRQTIPVLKYTPNEYAEVGRGLLCASLDISCNNPLPRVAPNQIKALRAQIQRQVVLQRNEKSKKSKITSKTTSAGLNFDRLSMSTRSSATTTSGSLSVTSVGGMNIPTKRLPIFSSARTSRSDISQSGPAIQEEPVRRKKTLSKLPRLKPKTPRPGDEPHLTNALKITTHIPAAALKAE